MLKKYQSEAELRGQRELKALILCLTYWHIFSGEISSLTSSQMNSANAFIFYYLEVCMSILCLNVKSYQIIHATKIWFVILSLAIKIS